MAESKNIKVTEVNFEEALAKLITLHTNLVSEQTTFESICSDLLEDWEGRASDEGDDVLEGIKGKFTNCVNNFEVIRKDMDFSLQHFKNSDDAIAQAIDEKTVIGKNK